MTALPKPSSLDGVALTQWLSQAVLEGVPPLSPSAHLAQEYLLDHSYSSKDACADALARQETARHFTTGFLGGLGESLSLPVPAMAPLVAAWLIEARMAGAIAAVYGHRLSDPKVNLRVLACLLGDEAPAALCGGGSPAARAPFCDPLAEMQTPQITRLSGSIGERLLALDVANPIDRITVHGGGVDELADPAACSIVARTAIAMFRQKAACEVTAHAGACLCYREPPS